jgi:hypothetical protein
MHQQKKTFVYVLQERRLFRLTRSRVHGSIVTRWRLSLSFLSSLPRFFFHPRTN